jgi:HK97 family phage major capsid protein
MNMKPLHSAVAGALGLVGVSPGLLAVFADDNPQRAIEALENKLLSLSEQADAIRARCDGEGRTFSDEERAELRKINAAFEDLEQELALRRAIVEKQARVGAVSPQATAAAAAGSSPVKPNAAVGTLPESSRIVRVDAVQPQARQGDWGWPTFGQFARAVMAYAVGGQLDPRLVQAAATTYSSEGVGVDGGFAVPPDFRSEIMRKVFGEESLLQRTDQQTTSSNSFTVPLDETTPWQTTGGVQAYWEGEAGSITQSKIALQGTTTKLNKLTALVPVTEELLEDATSLGNYLRAKAPEKMDFRIADAIINGTGAGLPLGILNSGATIEVAPESGQSADTVNFENIVKMWTRLYAPCKPRSVWLINGDVEQQLISMRFPGNNGTVAPVYMPPGGLSSAPYGTLMGRPVIPHEAVPGLGDRGDLILADLTKYLTVTKTGGVRQDVSIHLFFDQDITTFRFILRIGGQPWWKAPITRKASNALSRSCFVALGAR